jgi:hypothetical protein
MGAPSTLVWSWIALAPFDNTRSASLAAASGAFMGNEAA